jgi:hypothetical protein
MADLKISQLVGAATPLAGTEVLPIVQSGATTKVAIADVTAGRTVSMLGAKLTATTTATIYTDSVDGADNKRLILAGAGAAGTGRAGYIVSYGNEFSGSEGNIDFVAGVPGIAGSGVINFLTAGVTAFKVDENKNLVQGTAAKGVNFTANTPAAGMTSQLLNWYEEGTWTPTQGGGMTVVGAYTSVGTYVRIGRQVTITGSAQGATSISTGANQLMCSGLPFAVVSTGCGALNGGGTYAGTIVPSGTVLYGTAIPATDTLYFTATYFV